jgi:hypothetical protein
VGRIRIFFVSRGGSLAAVPDRPRSAAAPKMDVLVRNLRRANPSSLLLLVVLMIRLLW